jgi:hypothetical protein
VSSIMPRIRDAAGLSPTWPPRDQAVVWEEVDTLAGLRDSDDATLRSLAAAVGMSGTHGSYVTIPVPRMVSKVKADLLFGEAPEIAAESDVDQAQVDRLVDDNDLASELHRAALVASSEGEVWGKVTVAPQVLDVPMIEFVSRRHVIPRFAGRFVVGATFVSEWEDGNAVWRRLEEHTAGLIRTTLWLGTRTRLGQQRNLAERPETAELELNDGNASQVVTGIDRPLAVFIPNALDSDPTRGVSDYLGVVLGFLAINETETIGQANARLVGRKRLFVEGRFLNARGNFPTDDDVFRADASIAQDGGNGGAITPAEYTFESGELVGWLDHLVDLTMTMAGVSPVSVGRGDMGGARSGTALRLRMTHTLMEAAGTGRYFDRGLRDLLRMAQLLDAREFRRRYSTPDARPSVERGDGLPNDDLELAQELQMLRAAEVISLPGAVERQHPDWSAQEIADEVERIQGETAAAAAPPPAAAGPAGAAGAAGGSIPTPAPTITLGQGNVSGRGTPQGGTT